MQLPNVVNVIEIANTGDMSINQVVSFTDDAEGNAEANELFRKLVRENEPESDKMTDDELEACIDDGYYELAEGYYVAITHSTTPAVKA